MSMANLFEMIDTRGRGYITKEDFKEIFKNIGGDLKLNETELN
jgi:Ca2+-binding EF-hand superfamily protein